jgi:hypothetical protein
MGPPRPELQGSVALTVRFAPAEPGTVEPLLSVGEPIGGTLLMAEHLPRGGLRFQLRKAPLFYFSRAVPKVDTSGPHRLVVRYGTNVAGREREVGFAIMLDGVLLKDLPEDARRYSFDEVVAGWNTQGYAGCIPRFRGEIAALESARPGELEHGSWPLSVANRSLIEMKVRFFRLINSSEPVVITGRESAADIVFARRVGSGQMVFGQEHWGQAPELGPVVEFDESKEHTLQVALGPLFAHACGIVRPDCVRVTMDGRTVLETRQELYPFKDTEVYILDNPFAGSFCGRDFLGDVANVSIRSLDPLMDSVKRVVEGNAGPVTLTLRFDGSIMGHGRGLGLLETGVSGAGDIVYVVAQDRTHVRFYFDHWGIGGIVGQQVEIDPSQIHALRIEMGSLAAPEDRSPARALTVRLTLDNRVVLEGQSPCHPSTKGQIHVLENALGSGSVSAPFDGTCLAVERGGESVRLSY